MPRRLIEEAFPLKKVSKDSKDEHIYYPRKAKQLALLARETAPRCL